MAGYTRQSSASIVNGSAITAPPLNAEFNQLLAAFHATTGHTHTGATGNGTKIPLATSVSGFLPIANGGSGGKNNFTATSVPGVGDDSGDSYAIGSMWTNTSTDRVYICTDSSSGAAVWRELVQVTSLNAILPVSNNSVDIGSNSLRFQDLFLSGGISASGNAAVGGTLTLTGGTALNSTLTVTGVTALNGGLTMDSNKFTVANTSGNVATAGTLTVTGATALNGGLTMDSDKFTVANTSGNVATAGTLAVTGTSAFTGAITSNAGVVVDNITIDGTQIDLSSGDLTIDVAGDILLNADGGDIILQDGSATFGSLTNSGGNLIIKGGTTAAATFTGANVDFAGTVDVTGAGTFDSTLAVTGVLSPATHVDMPDNAKIKLGTGDDATLFHDGTNSFLTNATGALKISTETSGGAVTIGHTTSEVTIGDNLTVAGNLTVQGTQTVVDSVTMNAQNAVVFEGATADAHETTLTIVDPTADRTINLPNQSGTLPLLAAASNATISATPAELSIMDGDKSAVSTTLADADRVVVNDAGTMKQVAMSDFETFMETSLDTLANVTTVGALNAGTITSGFGAIDNGSSAITTSGTVNFGSISDGTITITGFVDDDSFSNASATKIPTAQSVEARIQAVASTSNNVTGLTASGAELNILDNATVTTAELNILDGSATTQATVTLAATDGVVISDADVMKQALVSDFDTYISGTTATLTNKTLSAPTLTGTAVVASLDISGDIDVDGVTNLDVVDIDGAVDMASTALVTGVLTTTAATVFNGGFASNADSTITVDDNGYNLSLISTDTDENSGPRLKFFRNSANPASADFLGLIDFTGKDAGGNETRYANIVAQIASPVAGGEGGKLLLEVATHDGEMQTGFEIIDGNAEDELDVNIGSGTSSVTTIAGTLTTAGAITSSAAITATQVEIGNGSAGGTSEILFSDNASARGKIKYNHGSNPEVMTLETTGTVALTIDNSQNVMVGKAIIDTDTVGAVLRANGEVRGTAQNAAAARFSRLSSDGEMVGFEKDGTSIGSILVSGGNNLTISGTAGDHAGLIFATHAILPAEEGVAASANVIDLGANGNEFKNLYLDTGIIASNALSITTGTNLTLDAAGNITLDADGGFLNFADAGNVVGVFENNGGHFHIKAGLQDKNILFRGNDNGNAITALTLDMADAGAATFNSTIAAGAATFTTADNTNQLTLVSTDADANAGPNLNLRRNSGSPADGDLTGQLTFTNNNDAGEGTDYVTIHAVSADVSNGSEDAAFYIKTMSAGTLRQRISLTDTETVLNEDSIDLDFRVESDNETHALFVQGSNGNVGIGTGSPNADSKMQVAVATNTVSTGSPANSSLVKISGGTTTVGDGVSLQLTNVSGAKETGWRMSAVTASGNNGDLVFNGYAGGSDFPERMRINAAGRAIIPAGITLGTATGVYAASNTLDDYETGTWTPTLGGNASYSIQAGTYVKVGRLVYVQGVLSVNALGTGSTSTLSGLPFASSNAGGGNMGGSVTYFANLAVNVITPTTYFPNGTTSLAFKSRTSAGNNLNVSNAIFGNSARVDFQLTYETTA